LPRARPTRPERIQLALRGSGQALYVGLADDAFIVASEPYGVVEDTAIYLRMDGETPGNPENPQNESGPDRRARQRARRFDRGHQHDSPTTARLSPSPPTSW
jgi:hypothetical protein